MNKQYISTSPWKKVRTNVLESLAGLALVITFALGLTWLALALTGGAK